MPSFNPTGWSRIDKPCTECGINRCYIKPNINGLEDMKQFHTKTCPMLPKDNGPKITDVEFKIKTEEPKLLE